MKPVFLFVLIMLAFVPHARAQEASTPKAQPVAALPSGIFDGIATYRTFIFGIGKEQIRAYEKAAFYEEDENSLSYLYKPDYFRRLITYTFSNNKLVGARHEIVELHLPNSSRIVDMFYDEQKRLTEWYGEPVKTELFWKNKRYEKYPAYWGRALYSRDLQMKTTWTPPGAVVTLYGYHDRYKYQIYYTFEPPSAAPENRNAIELTAGTPSAIQGGQP